MKPDGIKRVLARTIPAREPVLLVGPPGVGKTDIAHCSASDTSHDLVVTHPVVEDPTDAKGLPYFSEDKKSAVFLPFGQLHKLLNATRPTLWFMDDVGQASPATQAANMQWLLSREVNGHRLPDCVSIMAATNRKQDRAGVQGLLEPVKSRFITILNVEVDLNQWCYWAFQNGVPPILIAFLRWKEGRAVSYLHDFVATADMTNSRSPRTWANLARLYKLGLDPQDEQEAFGGSVGKAHADEFVAFLQLFRNVPNPDAVLLNPERAVIPDEPDILWALSSALIERVREPNFGRFATYADRLLKAGKGEFAALMLRGAVVACPDVQYTPEFTRIASTNSALLFAEI